MEFTVYRYKNKEDEIIYVGKSINLSQRVMQHRNTDTWSPEANKIEYIKLNSEEEMNLAEKYYIDLWNPKYNIMSKYNNSSKYNSRNDNWKVYLCYGENDFTVTNLPITLDLIKSGDVMLSDEANAKIAYELFNNRNVYYKYRSSNKIPNYILNKMIDNLFDDDINNLINITTIDENYGIHIENDNLSFIYDPCTMEIEVCSLYFKTDMVIGLADASSLLEGIRNKQKYEFRF